MKLVVGEMYHMMDIKMPNVRKKFSEDMYQNKVDIYASLRANLIESLDLFVKKWGIEGINLLNIFDLSSILSEVLQELREREIKRIIK